MLCKNKVLYSKSDRKQGNRNKLSTLLPISKETRNTRFDGEINTAVDRYKAMQSFSDNDDKFPWRKLVLPLVLGTSGTFTSSVPVSCPLCSSDGNEVPNSHQLSERFRHPPHFRKTSFKLSPAMTNSGQKMEERPFAPLLPYAVCLWIN